MLSKLVLIYLVVFYSQLGGRIPFLGLIRIEFILGGFIILGVVLKGELRFPSSRFDYSVLFYFVTLLISVPGSFWMTKSLDTLVEIAKAFCLYIMITSTLDSVVALRRFVWVYLLMVSLIVVEPLVYHFGGAPLIADTRGFVRLYGATGNWAHPNSLGGFAAANLPIAWYLFRVETFKFRKIWSALLLPASLLTITLTASRTAYVGVVAVLLLLPLFAAQKLKAFLSVLLFLVVVWLVLPNEYRNHISSLRQVDDVIAGRTTNAESLSERWEIIQDAFAIFLVHPILGVGVDAFQTARGFYFDRWQDTHNLYLQALAELGVVGGVAFAFLLYRILQNIREARGLLKERKDPEGLWLLGLANGLFLFLLCRLVVGLFGMDLYENYWWLAGGLSVCLTRFAAAPFNPAKREML